MICNEWNKEPRAFDINFLYNDKKYQGLPVCLFCIHLVQKLEGFNYTPRRIKRVTLKDWL